MNTDYIRDVIADLVAFVGNAKRDRWFRFETCEMELL
jgi:hypothetical protein